MHCCYTTREKTQRVAESSTSRYLFGVRGKVRIRTRTKHLGQLRRPRRTGFGQSDAPCRSWSRMWGNSMQFARRWHRHTGPPYSPPSCSTCTCAACSPLETPGHPVVSLSSRQTVRSRRQRRILTSNHDATLKHVIYTFCLVVVQVVNASFNIVDDVCTNFFPNTFFEIAYEVRRSALVLGEPHAKIVLDEVFSLHIVTLVRLCHLCETIYVRRGSLPLLKQNSHGAQ